MSAFAPPLCRNLVSGEQAHSDLHVALQANEQIISLRVWALKAVCSKDFVAMAHYEAAHRRIKVDGNYIARPKGWI